jgi:ABC-type transport system substrate-binding protein
MPRFSHHGGKHSALRVLGFCVLTSVLLARWGPSPVSRSALAAEQPEKGGVIVWAVHEGMPSFDIHYETSYVAAQPIGPLYNGLLAHDVYHDSEIVGDLAERWEVAEDGKRVTFHLHTGVKFHDGSDFTCADAQYSMAKLADRKRANPTFVAVLEEVYDSASCTDDFTLVMSLKRPAAALMTMLAGTHAAMMKKGIYETSTAKTLSSWSALVRSNTNPTRRALIFRQSAIQTTGNPACRTSMAIAPSSCPTRPRSSPLSGRGN